MWGCGCANKVQVCASFGMRLMSMLVQEYGAYYLTHREIVDLELSGAKKKNE